jgi:hypothetical protein
MAAMNLFDQWAVNVSHAFIETTYSDAVGLPLEGIVGSKWKLL